MLDYVNNGNLKQLISSCGNLHESALKIVALGIVNSLETYYTYTNKAYGTLYPSQILFKDNGTIKVILFLIAIVRLKPKTNIL